MFGSRYGRSMRAGVGATAAVMTLLVIGATRLDAQDSAAVSRSGWIVGGSLGMLGAGTETAPLELTIVGMSFTNSRPGRLGADIAIGTMPRALAAGAVVLGARMDATVSLAVAPGVLLLPAAGLSLIGGIGEAGGGGLVGYNVGAAAVFGTGNFGLRTGLTWHQLQDIRSGIWLLEVGVARLPDVQSR